MASAAHSRGPEITHHQQPFNCDRQTDKRTERHTDATQRPTHASGYTAGVVN